MLTKPTPDEDSAHRNRNQPPDEDEADKLIYSVCEKPRIRPDHFSFGFVEEYSCKPAEEDGEGDRHGARRKESADAREIVDHRDECRELPCHGAENDLFRPIPARTGMMRSREKEFRASLVIRSLAKNIQESPEYWNLLQRMMKTIGTMFE